MAQSAHVKLAALRAQLVTLQAKIVEVEAAAANEVDFSRAVTGAVVEFNFGKGDKATVLTGTILGVNTPDKGAAQAKVAVGEGFTADLKTIYLPYITKIVSSPVAEAGAPVANESPAEEPQA
jgi:hypothetical protein